MNYKINNKLYSVKFTDKMAYQNVVKLSEFYVRGNRSFLL